MSTEHEVDQLRTELQARLAEIQKLRETQSFERRKLDETRWASLSDTVESARESQAAIKAVQTEHTVILETVRSDLTEIKHGIRAINVTLTGNGKPEKGLISRVGRLEEKVSGAFKLIWTGLTAMVGAAGTAIVAYFTGAGK